jgi:hypothetical protein
MEMELEVTMVQSEVVDAGGLRTFQLLDDFLKDGFQLIQPSQSDLLDLQQPVLLVVDLTDLIVQVVQLLVGKLTH